MRYTVSTRARTSGSFPTILALVFLCGGTALWGINRLDPVPVSPAATHRHEITVTDIHQPRVTRSRTLYLRLVAHDHFYLLKSTRDDVDQVTRQVAIGDQVTVCSQPIAGREDRIWQLEKQDRVIVAFTPMRDRALTAQRRTDTLARVMQVLGGILLVGVLIGKATWARRG